MEFAKDKYVIAGREKNSETGQIALFHCAEYFGF